MVINDQNIHNNLRNTQLKDVRYNCIEHRSAHLFMMARSSHSHIQRKHPQMIFLQYRCSVTMIDVVKKHLKKKNQELNT